MARMGKSAVLDMVFNHWEDFQKSRAQALLLQKWQRGRQYDIDLPDTRFHGRPYRPRQDNSGVSQEYDNLAELSPSAWADLVVRSVAQTAYVEGVRMPGSSTNMQVWNTWQRNRCDSKQTAVHRAAIGLSTAYGLVLPGKDILTGDKMAKMTYRDPTRMAAWYADDDDEWAVFAIDAVEYATRNADGSVEEGWNVTVYDDTSIHYLTVKGEGWNRDDYTYISFEDNPLKVTPVARLCNRIDLDGHATGEIEPLLPLLRRIDQDVFDRLIVQRFGAWKVRYIAGLAKPSTQEQANLQALKLKVEDLLISGDKDTKFGTLDASDPSVYSSIHDADLRMLSAIAQIPPHHLLGLSDNLQAEALDAAEAGLRRKSKDFKMNAGEFHEQMFRMAAMMDGNTAEASAAQMQVRWAVQDVPVPQTTAQALGLLATQLQVPVEMLWEYIPDWTDTDVQRAKDLVTSGDAIDQILAELANQGGGADTTGTTEEPPSGGQ